MQHRFVGLSTDGKPIHLFEEDRTTEFRQVLWGDYLDVDADMGDDWLRVLWAPKDPEKRRELYIRKSLTIATRPLEIIFLDVGQGDGAVLITPERDRSERIIVIDAGERQSMGEFLEDRFKAYGRGFTFHAAVITHPDQDHYLGFKPIFESSRIGFDVIYHSGLVERPVSGTFDKLGGLTADKDPKTKKRYLTDLARDDGTIRRLFRDESKVKGFRFPEVMHAAVTNERVKAFSMLSTDDGVTVDGRTYMPGFSPQAEHPRGYTIEVLGPVVERSRGKRGLRQLGTYGETKNGHSVILRLTFGGFRILFGGDLNEKAEEFLLAHYAGLEGFPARGTQAYKEMVTDASKVFRAEVMKVCHHGSEKVTDAFLQAVDAAAFIISSGDEEGHVHPRPDLLGRLGSLGRGPAPVILSTELQRSTRELEDEKVVKRLKSDIAKLATAPTQELRDVIDADVEVLGRTNVAVWGTIYVKTDGERLIAAFKKESRSDTDKWFYFEYAFDPDGLLRLVER